MPTPPRTESRPIRTQRRSQSGRGRIRADTGPTVLVSLLSIGLAVASPAPVSGQDPCPSASAVDAESGWTAYQANDMAGARALFASALARCANDHYARTGLGYVELREGGTATADSLFSVVLAAEPNNVDALVGLGLARWRTGDLQAVRDNFALVLELAPGHPTAIEYLERIEGRVLGVAPDRPPLVLPDQLTYPARTAGDRFEIRTAEGWRPFWIKGVNLGAALPGKHPSEFPDSAVYARWLQDMADMNANTVRVYTIHPPAFYDALLDWNRRNPERPLWLIHGVWTELPPNHDYTNAEFEAAFFGEMRSVVDVLHGRADIEPRPGRAFGHYVSDVSPWTLAYIIGREWEPFSAMAFDSAAAGRSGYEGEYVRVVGGNALDAWMGRAVEQIVAYETETYRAQRPVAYTNWPTLDPLEHPTEPTVEEEMAIRRARGERPDMRIREYDNDGLGLDASRVRPTERLPAGYFASYHAYPYYPDFMILGADLQSARSSIGRSNYFGYLSALKRHHPDVPVVISEYGVPASLGIGHLQPQGWHHGGLTETEMAEADARLTMELAEAGMAGGIVFAWIDEWFKKNWVALEFELPGDRNRLWYNRLDAEQHYGVWALEARPPLRGGTLAERLPSWREISPLDGRPGLNIRAAHDEAYLWLLVETEPLSPADTLLVGFDVIRPSEGDFAWPGRVGERLPVGLEFVLRATGDEVRVMADQTSNPFRLVDVGQGATGLEGRQTAIENPPPGLFYARKEQRFNLPYYTRANEDGRYDSLRVIVNRRRFARDSTEYLGIGYDRGILPAGSGPDGLWQRTPDRRVLEIRVPWLLINVTDPSSRSVLQGPGVANTRDAELGPDGRWRLKPGVSAWPDSVFGEFGIEETDGIGLVATVRRGVAGQVVLPQAGRPTPRYRWSTWEVPRWEERRRPVFDAMRDLFEVLDPYSSTPAIQPGREPPAPGAPPPAGPPPADPSVPRGGGGAGQVDAADAAWREGDTDRALQLYEARLAANPSDAIALHRLALMRAWVEEYAAAFSLFDRLLEIEPANPDARVDRARVLAWSGDTDRALRELDAVLAAQPAHRDALEARALFQAWAGRYEESLSSYEQLLSIHPDDGTARRQRAQVLSWASDFEASQRTYEQLLAENPDDLDARLGLARTRAYSGELDAALTEYDRVLSVEPENVAALQGKGRTLAWADRLVAGEEVLRRAVAVDESNADSWMGLGQILSWQGRDAAAMAALERAVAISPTNGDAREQLRAIRTALSPYARPSVVYEADSDDNRMITTSVSSRWHATPRLRITAEAYRRGLDQGPLGRSASAVSVTGAYQLEPGWTVSGGLGGSVTDAPGDVTDVSVRAGIRSPGRHRAVASFDFASQMLDETAALASRSVRYTSYSGSVRWTPIPGWRFDGNVGYARFAGVEDNSRVSGSVSGSRRFGRALSVGASYRAFSYAKDLAEGYFDPDFYGIAEITGSWRATRAPWSLLVEVAPGVQQVLSDGERSFSLRGTGRLGYLIGAGRELSLSYGYSSAGLLSFSTGASDYRYTAIVAGLDWVF